MFKSISALLCSTFIALGCWGQVDGAEVRLFDLDLEKVQRVRSRANATPDDHAAFMLMTKEDLALTRSANAESLKLSLPLPVKTGAQERDDGG